MKRYATQKFRVGQSVHLTRVAIRQGFVSRRYPPSAHGDVKAVQDPFRVKVRRLGRKEANWYHIDFWTACHTRETCIRRDFGLDDVLRGVAPGEEPQ